MNTYSENMRGFSLYYIYKDEDNMEPHPSKEPGIAALEQPCLPRRISEAARNYRLSEVLPLRKNNFRMEHGAARRPPTTARVGSIGLGAWGGAKLECHSGSIVDSYAPASFADCTRRFNHNPLARLQNKGICRARPPWRAGSLTDLAAEAETCISTGRCGTASAPYRAIVALNLA